MQLEQEMYVEQVFPFLRKPLKKIFILLTSNMIIVSNKNKRN